MKPIFNVSHAWLAANYCGRCGYHRDGHRPDLRAPPPTRAGRATGPCFKFTSLDELRAARARSLA